MGFLTNLFGKPKRTKKLSKQELTEEFAKLIKSRIANIKLTILDGNDVDKISIIIDSAEGRSMTFYPDNLYYAYLQGGDRFDEYKENILDNIEEMLNPVEETAVLLPAIKPISWLQHTKQRKQPDASEITDTVVYLPLAGDLIIVFTLDLPNRMSFLYQSQLTDYVADGNLATLYQMALDNFRARLKEVTIEKIKMGYTLSIDSNYDASLVLVLDELLPNIPLEGEAVIGLIARDQFVIVDSSKPEQLTWLANYAKQQLAEAPYALSSELFCFRNHKVALYKLQ